MLRSRGFDTNRILLFSFVMTFLIAGIKSCDASESIGISSRNSTINGFNLSYALIDKSKILSGGPAKDGIPALVNPQTIPPDQANYLKPMERVIGVEINGETRAYPLNILIWHEVINDTVGGVPILVTYCPLCDSALVFHREIDGVVREFGVSGLLYQSNVLLYDRHRDSRSESLWSQLGMRAVSGPAARKELKLEIIDADLVSAQAWIALHPYTSILSLNTGYNRPYTRPAYTEYFASDQLMFNVSKRTNRRPDLANKDQIVFISVGNNQKVYVYSDIQRSPNQKVIDKIGDTLLEVKFDPITNQINVEPVLESDSSVSSVDIKRSYMFWFAFDKFFPNVEVYQPIID